MRFSQSLLDKADNCLLSMQYAVEDDRYFDGIVRAVGTAYHAGHEHYYRRWRRGTPPPVDEVIDVAYDALNGCIMRGEAEDTFVWDEKFPDEEAARVCVAGMLRHYYTVVLEDGPIPWTWEVADVEVPWELPHPREPGILLTSRGIDLVLRDPNGFIVGVDHKTSGKGWDEFKHHPRKKAQGPLYVWAMQQLYPGAPGYRFVYDVIGYPNKKAGKVNPAGWCNFSRRIADPAPAHIEAALARVETTAWLYQKVRAAGVDMPANPSSTLCSQRYCDFFDLCPFGKVLHTPLS